MIDIAVKEAEKASANVVKVAIETSEKTLSKSVEQTLKEFKSDLKILQSNKETEVNPVAQTKEDNKQFSKS